ncbi:MAG: nucleoside phosphorylase [Thermonemataceae bacterium]
MNVFTRDQLILNQQGAVYHLNLLPGQVADTIIVVGDPERVPKVTQYFDEVTFKTQKREFVTHTGTYKGKPLSVISSGIGTGNVEILLLELDALFNIDLEKRLPKEKRQVLQLIRIGTSGALQAAASIDSFVASQYAVGLDTLMSFYDLPQTPLEASTGENLQTLLSLPFRPYCVMGSEHLLTQLTTDMIIGNTVTTPGFYAPQGRQLQLAIKYPDLVEQLSSYEAQDFWLMNFEMETAGYYALCRLLGHEILSVSAILANRITAAFSQQAEATVDRLIRTVLERLVALK